MQKLMRAAGNEGSAEVLSHFMGCATTVNVSLRLGWDINLSGSLAGINRAVEFTGCAHGLGRASHE